jgi:16S rRNA (uracil1498-N3)-methyltransferase
MSQFLANPVDVDASTGTVLLRGEEAHHLARVTRARPGDRVRLFDGTGNRWEGVLDRHDRETSTISRLIPLPANEPPHPLVLAAGLVKVDRWEWMIEKAVELGATTIVPLACARSQVKAAEAARKSSRWEKIILSAAKQCERGIIPELCPPLTADEFVNELAPPASGETRWVLVERAEAAWPTSAGMAKTVALGPEGGFSDEETELFAAAGFTPATLGSRILRSETAALAALALVGVSK